MEETKRGALLELSSQASAPYGDSKMAREMSEKRIVCIRILMGLSLVLEIDSSRTEQSS